MKCTLLLIFTLPTVTLAAAVQPRIPPNKETHNSGQIEWRKPVTVRYTITNAGNGPLALINVTTPCVCAVTDWTKESTAPSAKGAVKASSDVEVLERFSKSISTYSNATLNLVYLRFTGGVVQGIKDYSKLLPHVIGNVRIDYDESSFPNVYRRQQPSATSNIANPFDHPYRPMLMYLPPYLKIEAEPKVLLKGKKGAAKLILDVSQLQGFGLTQTSVHLSRLFGDKASEDNEIPVPTILLPDFSRMTGKDSLSIPPIHISETSTDLGTPLIKRNKVSHDISIANTGKTPLVIGELQVSNSSVGVGLKKTVIPPDGMTKLKATTHKRDVGNKKYCLRISTITNDLLRPKAEINIRY